MISDEETAILRSEVVALQAVMMAVFRRMASDRPELGATFCKAFDEAETILSGVAIKIGIDAPLESTVGALRVIEELRKVVIRDESLCSGQD
jgi:hypothetical protein